jgi:hypothetical protein
MEELRAPLDAVGATYAVMGDVAATYWGLPSLSAEIEVAIELTGDVGTAVCRWFVPPERAELVGPTLRAPVLVVKYFAVGVEWNVSTQLNDSAFLRSAIARRVTVGIGERPTPLITVADCVLLKLIAWDAKDRAQLDDLLLVVGPLDDKYLAAWADKLGVRDRLEEQWRRSGRVLRA